MNILGISAYYHDSAAAIIKNGVIIAAAQEERFTRIKNDNNFPIESIRYCLQEANLKIDDLNAIVYYEKPFLKFERLLETYYAFAPKGVNSFIKSVPVWIKEKLFIKKNIRKGLKKIQPYNAKKLKLLFPEHHLSHAASAYYPSGFEEAAILTIDGVGEFATTTICKGSGNKINIIKEFHFPHSVGLLYSAFTYFLGFKVNSDEYKLMGLAAYGDPGSEQTKEFVQLISNKIVTIFDDGSVFMNQYYFKYATGLRMINEQKFEKLFGFKKRNTDEDFLQHHLNCAMAIQQITEEIVIKLAIHAKEITQSKNLCLAGGVALNCVANGKIQNESIFENLFIQPAAGDAGGALGAALAAYHLFFNKELIRTEKKVDEMSGSYLGPSFSNTVIENMAGSNSANFKKFDSIDALCKEIARLIDKGNVIGWFQGRMEYGPRALGNRSILADARNPDMQRKINLKIKFREGFRPFAPAVLAEDAKDYFELNTASPYMQIVQKVNKSLQFTMPPDYLKFSLHDKLQTVKSKLPAITHADFTARIQTVSKETNPAFHALLTAFKELTGCAVLINTSLNIRDEPIVCTPQDAYSVFLKTKMDFLVIGNYLFYK